MNKRYKVEFIGKQKNAIGAFHPIVSCREADSPNDALMDCYNEYEHIHQPRVFEVMPDGSKQLRQEGFVL